MAVFTKAFGVHRREQHSQILRSVKPPPWGPSLDASWLMAKGLAPLHPHSLSSQGQRLGCSVALGRKLSHSGGPGGFHMLSPRSPKNSTGSQQRLQEVQLLLPATTCHKVLHLIEKCMASSGRLPSLGYRMVLLSSHGPEGEIRELGMFPIL